MGNNLGETVSQNLSFVIVCICTVVIILALAIAFEHMAGKRSGSGKGILDTRTVVVVGMFSAISAILYSLDFPVFFAPTFYKLDFSELPALIAGFAFGPVSAVLIEFIKVLVKILIKGTSTAFVGDLANFVIGCSFVLPASIIYHFNKTKRTAVFSCVVGTLVITVFGSLFNAFYLLPAFAALYGMPMDALIAMGTKVNPAITGIYSFVLLAVAPLNLVKGALISIITILVYKRLSVIIKRSGGNSRQR